MATISKLRFIQLLPNTVTDGKFILKDLPGSGKRIDLLCRVLSACFDWGPVSFPRFELEVIAILHNDISLVFQNPTVLPKGEVAWARKIQRVLQGQVVEHVMRIDIGLEEVLTRFALPSGKTWVLREDGKPLKANENLQLNAQNSFILGDHIGFDENASRIIESVGVESVSLGETSYLSSHCVAAVISEFERRISK
ncbi:MAG: hypothetical protein GF411_11210 [Candidatus Lokiarchaeota archaeon]|nr:hypothetical protein [Candidatus Lokiarchaeota archaeon]